MLKPPTFPHIIYVDDDDEHQEELKQKEIETLSAELRAKRDAELNATDFYLMLDYPISDSDLTLIQKYRQELRDLPQQEDFPYVDFPVNPLTPKVEE